MKLAVIVLALSAISAVARNDFDKAVTEVAENAEKAAEVYAAEAKKFPSTQELMDDMDKRNEKDDRATQSEMISETQAALAAAKTSCPACETDYSTLCPEGWTKNRNGGCVAQTGYTKCEAMGFFGQYSVEDKQAFEKRCGVCWPCYKAPAAFLASAGLK
jgi:CPW-WPC domain-containing protein